MEEVTLLDLAKEIGVTKSAINQKLSREDKEKYLVKIGNKYTVNDMGQKAIKLMFKDRKAPNKNVQKNANENDKLLDSLMESSKADKEQLKEKDKQIEKMQKLLDQQQQLHLQANQRIEHLEKQLTIEPPKDETADKKDEEAIQSYQEKIQELEKQVAEDEKINAELYEEYERLSKLEKEWSQQATNKKWFQFWKRG